MPTEVLRPHFAHVAEPAAAPLLGVGIEHLQPAASSRQADAVAVLREGGEVRDAYNHVAGRHCGPCCVPLGRPGRTADAVERQDVVVRVAGIYPAETFRREIELPECWLRPVQSVGLSEHTAQLGVVLPLVEHPPVEGPLVVPLPLFSQFGAHEKHLFARMGPHPGVKRSQVCELLPSVAGHLGEHRALTVHNLVVGKGEYEVLVPGVKKPECQIVLVVPAIKRVGLEVPESVVHPAHVPLVTKAEPAQVRRPGDPGPRGGLLGDSGRPGVQREHELIELLQESHRLEVFVAAEDVRHPFAGLPRIIEVEHRCDGIDPERVDMELVGPKKCVR